MKKTPDGLLFSPKDLLAYAEGDFVAWMERATYEKVAPYDPDPDDPELELLKQSGMAHEERVLAREKGKGLRVAELSTKGTDQLEVTRRAMAEGVDTIYQACLRRGDIQGYADFLRRVDIPSRLGTWSYEPWDTKLARTVSAKHVLQLAAYCDMLEEMQGVLPPRFGFVLGNDETAVFRTLDFIHCYREVRDRFLAFQEEWRPGAPPDPALDRSHGRWSTAADAILVERDHLTRIANISRSQVKRLEEGGIATCAALAGSPPRPKSIDAAIYTRLVRQARLQAASVGQERPAFEVPVPEVDAKPAGLQLLPPSSAGDIYFDMEGFPHVEGGLEYLFGAVTREQKEWTFHDWWAHDVAEERAAFEGFVDWAYARWKTDPAMHIYHYAAYETTALKRLMGKFGSREAEVDDLLRNQVFVDLYAVVRQGVAVGTPSYSLKDVERLYRGKRGGEVTTAGGSVVAYHVWRESGEVGDWKRSPWLKVIRDYNEDDCVSTGELAEWLRERQRGSKIGYVAPEFREKEEGKVEVDPGNAALVEKLEAMGDDGSPARTLAGLLEYHRREVKPAWWQYFAWLKMTTVDLIDADDPLGGLMRTGTGERTVKASVEWEYSFPPQETSIDAGVKVRIAVEGGGPVSVSEFDPVKRTTWLRRGKKSGPLPESLDLIPHDVIGAEVIAESIVRYAERVANEGWPMTGVSALLQKRAPAGAMDGDLKRPGEDVVDAAVRIAKGLAGEVLCLQGPPGAGKTYTAAHVIAALLADGKRVGVTSTGHKVVDKVLTDTIEVLAKGGEKVPVLKVGGEDYAIAGEKFERVANAVVAAAVQSDGPLLVGGTAWLFSREELAGKFHVLLVDEAGQYPLANAVGSGQAAGSLILVGDQMQLAQPRKGTHPGLSGSSALEYYISGHPTIPPELGLFLDRTRRLHPAIGGFISQAFYEGRLEGIPGLEAQLLDPAPSGARIQERSGIVTVDVPHVGNDSASEEEAEVVRALAAELVGRGWQDRNNVRKTLAKQDILVIAPFNDQVGRLEAALGPGFRVGTVDRFQGQEAPVVIVSMTSSTLDDAPRGAEFLLSPNRLNVAISRAQALAIVVASPELERVRPTSVAQMKLVDRLCWVRRYS